MSIPPLVSSGTFEETLITKFSMKYTNLSENSNGLVCKIGLYLGKSCPGNQHSPKWLRHRPRPLSLLDAARAYALADTSHFWCLTPQRVPGSHQCVFHGAVEITWGKPASPWKEASRRCQPTRGREKLLAWKPRRCGSPQGCALSQPPQSSPAAPGSGASPGLQNKDPPESALALPHVFPPASSESPPGESLAGRRRPRPRRPAAGRRPPRRFNGRGRHGNATPLSGARAAPSVPSPRGDSRERSAQSAAPWAFLRATPRCSGKI